MANVFSEANFEDEVLKSDIPVLVDFWATWCGPLPHDRPIIDQLSTELAGKIKVGKVDVDANNGLAATYGVRTIPTLLVIKDGKSWIRWWEPLPRTPSCSVCVRSCNRTGLFIQAGLLRNVPRQAGFFCSWGLSE